MTAVTAPGAVRGRAREGASRRKELEDDHDLNLNLNLPRFH